MAKQTADEEERQSRATQLMLERMGLKRKSIFEYDVPFKEVVDWFLGEVKGDAADGTDRLVSSIRQQYAAKRPPGPLKPPS